MNKMIILSIMAVLFCTQCQGVNRDDTDNTYKPLELSTKSSTFIRQGNTFTFEFIDRINRNEEKEGNDYIISPLSMQFLLGMILDGAQGETAAEICKVLGYGVGEVDAVNEFCLSMLKQLPQLDKKTTLAIANAIFVDDGWPLLDSYKKTVSDYYRAEVANLDFSNNEASLRAINGWCSDHTNKLIPKILDQVDPNMLAYLLNALYFKSEWTDKFSKNVTGPEIFTGETGAKAQVQMMKMQHEFRYADNDVFQSVCLPYGNGAFSMYVLLPNGKYTVSDITAFLKKQDWDVVRQKMQRYEVNLWLPKFETKFHINLNDILSQMGMPSSFDSVKADFKAMSNYALCLSFVNQDAVIKVDEEGSEAAAVSSAGMMKTTAVAPGDYIVFHADHPFLYLITENSTGAVLFAGKYSGK